MKKYLLLIISFVIVLGFQNNNKIVIHLAGDSTLAEKKENKRPETGWGEKLHSYFNDDVLIKNHAKNGRSTRTFIEEGLWKEIVDSLNVGEYVFIQFGHNDESKQKVDRYTPPEDFKKNLRLFVAEVIAKKGIPVLITPVVRRRFDKNGKFYDVHGEYPDLVRKVAKTENVALLELHQKSEDLLTKLGAEKTKELFLWLKPRDSVNYPNGLEDNTHFSDYGANVIAGLVAKSISATNLELKKYLLEK